MLGRSPPKGPRRRGIAAVELAALLPLLAVLVIMAVDYARVLYYAQVVDSAARGGALYGTRDSTHAADTAGIQQAALADATNLTPAPGVTSTTANDASGNPEVQVTVTWTFQTLVNYPGIPSTVNLTRTATMRVLP
jgi:Flp pilus assembly protein TadG